MQKQDANMEFLKNALKTHIEKVLVANEDQFGGPRCKRGLVWLFHMQCCDKDCSGNPLGLSPKIGAKSLAAIVIDSSITMAGRPIRRVRANKSEKGEEFLGVLKMLVGGGTPTKGGTLLKTLLYNLKLELMVIDRTTLHWRFWRCKTDHLHFFCWLRFEDRAKGQWSCGHNFF